MCSSNFTKDGTTYKVVGNHSNALIFIHGVGIQSDVWQPQIEYFCKTYRVIVYDLLGHGESPVQKKAILDDYVKQLYLLSSQVRIFGYFFGHSMGVCCTFFALKPASYCYSMVFIRSESGWFASNI